MLHFTHAVAITGAIADGKTHLWQSLAGESSTSQLSSVSPPFASSSYMSGTDSLCAGVFEARGVKTAWKQV